MSTDYDEPMRVIRGRRSVRSFLPDPVTADVIEAARWTPSASNSKILEVPQGWKVAALIPVGHPGETPEAPPRRSIDRLWKTVGPAADEEG
jgi:nitroreductase